MPHTKVAGRLRRATMPPLVCEPAALPEVFPSMVSKLAPPSLVTTMPTWSLSPSPFQS